MEENRYQIICHSLDGKLPASAADELALWRKTTPENEQQYQEIKLLWQQIPYAEVKHEALNIDIETALKQVASQLSPTAKVVPLRSNWQSFLAAASVLFILGIGAWWMFAAQPEMVQVATAKNETKEVTLPDNSTAWLNENSTLTYPASFAAAQRTIAMEGDVVFEVTHHPQQPFVVTTDDLAVKVLGTKFNIRTTGNAPTVHVLNGKVAVNSIAEPTQSIKLTKGMTAELNKETSELALQTDFTENDLFWLTETLVFNEMPFAEVVNDLTRAYDRQITFSNNALANCPVRGTFIKKSLPEILGTLQLIYGFEITQSASSTIQIKKGSCH
ncbi:MAG: FecR family protein [Saprospiraceae bacterium]